MWQPKTWINEYHQVICNTYLTIVQRFWKKLYQILLPLAVITAILWIILKREWFECQCKRNIKHVVSGRIWISTSRAISCLVPRIKIKGYFYLIFILITYNQSKGERDQTELSKAEVKFPSCWRLMWALFTYNKQQESTVFTKQQIFFDNLSYISLVTLDL